MAHLLWSLIFGCIPTRSVWLRLGTRSAQHIYLLELNQLLYCNNWVFLHRTIMYILLIRLFDSRCTNPLDFVYDIMITIVRLIPILLATEVVYARQAKKRVVLRCDEGQQGLVRLRSEGLSPLSKSLHPRFCVYSGRPVRLPVLLGPHRSDLQTTA